MEMEANVFNDSFFLLIHNKEISLNYEICRILKHQRLD